MTDTAAQQELIRVRKELAGLRLSVGLVYRQTQPRMHWVIAAAVAAVITIPAISIGLQHAPQEVQDTVDMAVDWVANHSAMAGRAWSDYTGNVDRSYSLPEGDMTMIGLDSVQSCRWRHAVRVAESSGNYGHPGNQYGYFAGYGFGAEALSIVGLVKRSAFQSAPYAVRSGNDQSAWLDNPNNWTLAGGKAAFLQSEHLQDVAVTALANANIEDGFDSHVLSKSKPEQIAGFAAAAHLKGLRHALNWYLRGADSHDANGTPASKYAAIGEASISQSVAECGDGGSIQPRGFWSGLMRASGLSR